MSQDQHDQNDVPRPAPSDATSAEPVPDSPETVSDPPRSRRRWTMAALASVGVALFAVPLLRGPAGSIGDGGGSNGTPVPADAGSCATDNGRANLDFTLKDINGNAVRLSEFKGKVILLNFWATWCGPCKMEIPEFVEAYKEYRDRGFVILGVLSEDDPPEEDLRAFMREFEMNYPVLRENVEFSEAFGEMWALPTSYLIDRHGTICLKHMGAVSREMLEREIKGLL